MTISRFLPAITLVFACLAQPALAQIRAELVTGGLTAPVAFVQDPSQPNVQVVVQQGGRVRVIENGVLLNQDFLNLTSEVVSGGEQGLLGLAFAPDYATSGRVYVNFTNVSGHTVIARFVRHATDPLRADPATRFDLVWPNGLPYIQQPFANHNGGNLVFGPDGYLYIGLGDGGDANDPFHLAQTPGSLLGKMLRIDTSVSAAHPNGYVVPATNPFVGQGGVLHEIWAFGLRNPWRYSFDDPARGGTGALIVADVGQASWEEVNYEPAGKGGRNYGWRNREGAHDNVVSLPPFSLPLTDPIHEYARNIGQAITGGFVYRGSALGAAYTGRYFFADIIANRVWSLALSIDPATGEATVVDISEHTAELGAGANGVSSFGIDANGELYLVSYGAGGVYRVAFNGPPPPPSSCTTVQPGPTWTCVDGNWLPPGFPIPGTPPPPPPPPLPGPSSTCPTIQPGPEWICFNGNWLPPGTIGSCSTILEGSVPGPSLTVITVPPGGGSMSILTLVDPPLSCPWSAISEVNWITVTSPAYPTIQHGDGSLQFTVEPNTSGVERIGRIAVAEKFLIVIQPPS